MAHIFISHSSRNNDKAIEVRDWLAANGWTDVFLDLDPERGIVAGQRWKEALQKAAHRCEVVLALVSPEWLASGWCKTEIDAARLMGKKVIVALVGIDKAQVPVDLIDEQFVDLSADPQAYRRLKEGLKRAGLDPTSFPFDPSRPPYPGLAALEEQDAAVFFGRDAQIVRGLDEIRRLVRTDLTRLLVILGASGSGKSSFLRAGLWPRLKRDDRAWLPLPILRPERAAISGKYGLAEALRQVMSEPRFASGIRQRGLPQSPADIQDFVEKTDDGLAKLFAALRDIAQAAGLSDENAAPPTILLGLDQGEELFNEEGREEARRFIEILTKTLTADHPRALAILAMRSDSFPLVQVDPRLATLPKDTFTLDMMLEGSYRAVIEGPARLVEPPLRIDPQLTDALLKDISGQDALPLLAFTLAYLYARYVANNELTLRGYDQIGRVRGVIDETVAQAFAEAVAKGEAPKAKEAQLALARSAFIPHLAQVNAAGQAVRRVTAREKIPEGARALVDRFADQRLLIRDRRKDAQGHDVDVVEVAHEALLRQPPFSRWLEEDREFLVWRERLSQARADFEANKRGLLAGRELDIARDWMQTRAEHEIEPADQAFIRESIAADDKRRAEEAAQRKRRQRLLVGALVVFALLAVAASGAAIFGFLQKGEAERRKGQAEEETATSLIDQGDALGLANQWGQAKESYTRASDMLPKLGSDTFPAQLGLWNAYEYSPPELLSVEADRESVFGIAVDADGRTAVSAGYDGNLKFWNLSNGALIRVLPANHGSALCVAFSNDGKKILSGSTDGTTTLWDAETGNRMRDLVRVQDRASRDQRMVRCVAFSSDAKLALAGYGDGQIVFWRLEDGQPLRVFSGHTAAVFGVAFSPDDRLVASGAASDDNSARLWDANTGREIWSVRNYSNDVFSVAFSPDGHQLLTSGDNALNLWDVQSHQHLRTFAGHRLAVTSVSFSRDGSRVLSASYDRTVRVWDVASGRQLVLFSGHNGVVSSAALSPNGKLAVSAGQEDGQVKVWSTTPNEVLVMGGHRASLESVAFSPDGLVAVSGARDNTLKFWDLATGEMLRSIAAHTAMVRSVACARAPDGRFVVLSGGYDGAVKLWDVATGQLVRAFGGDGQRVESVALSHDGLLAIAGGSGKTAHVWEVATGREVAVFRGDGHDDVFSVAFSPDATLALTGYGSGVIRLWDVKSAHEIRKFTGHTYVVRSLAFSPDGRTFLSGGWDAKLKLWDVNTGRELRTFGTQTEVGQQFAGKSATSHETDSYHSVAFSPRDRTVAISASSGGLKLWDVKTGNQIRSFERHRAAVGAAAFSPNGDAWLSGSGDQTVMFWDFSRIAHYRELMPRVPESTKRLQTNPDDPAALATLGEWYAFRGINDQAIQFLTKARAQGATVSSLLIARCYWKLGAFRAARTEFQKARDAHEASNFYIDLCLNAIPKISSPTPTSSPLPVSQASPSPCPSAAEWLTEAQHYLDAKDYAKAFPLLQKAADAGDAEAMDNLAWLYRNALGTTEDDARAREWYQKAAEAGNVNAMDNLGWLYESGVGVTRDYARAREWYQKAAATGNADAKEALARLSSISSPTPASSPLPVSQASPRPSPSDAELFAEAKRYLDAKDYAQALSPLQKAAEAGNADAMAELGWLYQHGQGVTEDYPQARQWYQKAADAGNADAKRAVAWSSSISSPAAAASPSPSPVETTPVPEGGPDATPRATVLPAPPASNPLARDDAAAIGQDGSAATAGKLPEGGSERLEGEPGAGRAEQDDLPALGPKARGRHHHRSRPQPPPTFWQRLFGLFGHEETKTGKPRP